MHQQIPHHQQDARECYHQQIAHMLNLRLCTFQGLERDLQNFETHPRGRHATQSFAKYNTNLILCLSSIQDNKNIEKSNLKITRNKQIGVVFYQLFQWNKQVCYNKSLNQMQKQSNQATQNTLIPPNNSFFRCWSCIGNEQQALNQVNPSLRVYELRKSRQNKKSLRMQNVPSNLSVPLESEFTLARSNVNRTPHFSENLEANICNKIDKISSDRPQQIQNELFNNSTQQIIPEMKPLKTMSLRQTNETSLLSTISRPKINFFYNQTQIQKQVPKSYSTLPGEPLTPVPALSRTKISQVNIDLSPLQSLCQESKTEEQIVENQQASEKSSFTSPLNKLYKTEQKELLVSLQFRKKSSKNSSNESSQRIKVRRLPSHNEPFSKAKVKVRQTVSIKQPEEQSERVSVVITNSLINSFHGLLLPIDETELETRLSQYKD